MEQRVREHVLLDVQVVLILVAHLVLVVAVVSAKTLVALAALDDVLQAVLHVQLLVIKQQQIAPMIALMDVPKLVIAHVRDVMVTAQAAVAEVAAVFV